jgi:uncharacterized protein (DUF697 family)
MQLAGLGVRDVVGVMRDARETAGLDKPVVVTGVLAAELARDLRAGARDDAAVRLGSAVDHAAAVVVVLGGAPTAEDERVLRDAARACVPAVAVQTDAKADAPLAYVPASAVVVCPPGRGFPVEDIARALADGLGSDAVPLAARLPALRPHVVQALVRRASRQALLVGALPWGKGADFPALALIQARLVLDVAAAHGHPLDRSRAPELAAVAASGLGGRALVRRLPRRLPLVGGVTAYLATRALGEAASKRFELVG